MTPSSQHMPCPREQALLALHDHELPEVEANELRNHVASCAPCAQALETIQMYQGVVAELAGSTASAPFSLPWEDVEKAIVQDMEHRSTGPGGGASWMQRPPVRWAFAAAAAVGLALVGGPLLNQLREGPGVHTPLVQGSPLPSKADPAEGTGPSPDHVATVLRTQGAVTRSVKGGHALGTAPVHPGDRIEASTRVRTAAKAELVIALAQGSQARLIPGSEMEVVAQNRLRIRRGSVHNRVSKRGPGQSYEVWAKNYRVVVRGTQFSVAVDDGAVAVEVTEGTVEVFEHPGVAEITAEVAMGSSEDAPVARLPAPARWRSTDVSPEYTRREAPGARPMPDVAFANGQREVHGIHGSLPRALIAPVVQRGLPRLQQCQETHARGGAALEARMRMRIHVGQDGAVTDVELRSSSPVPPRFRACIRGHVLQWKFPAPIGGAVVIEQPLHFSAEE